MYKHICIYIYIYIENDQLKRQNLSAYESGSNNAKLKPLNPLMATS